MNEAQKYAYEAQRPVRGSGPATSSWPPRATSGSSTRAGGAPAGQAGRWISRRRDGRAEAASLLDAALVAQQERADEDARKAKVALSR